MLYVIDLHQNRRLIETAPAIADHERSALKAMPHHALSLDEAMIDSIDLAILSHEGRLILQLLRKRGMIIKDAWLSSRLSSRAFHELLKRLEAHGVIEISANATDRRTKSIDLTPDFKIRFLSQLRKVDDGERWSKGPF